jgi:alkanesulfonate monooxygenase SsuD/methylene tetrahydromethanopterin reductase-like flavin-dependent oxidoreductase (luciferase family)
MMTPGPSLHEARAVVEQAAVDAGRDPATIGMEGRVDWRGDADAVADRLAEWQKAGATHVSVNTMGAGLTSVDDHLSALSAVAATLPDG